MDTNQTTAQTAVTSKRKIIFKNFQSLGDIVMLTAAIRDIHLTYPGQFLTDVRTPISHIWENNPYLTRLNEQDSEVLKCEYPLIHQSNEGAYHFVHGFRKYINDALNLNIRQTRAAGDIHISQREKGWISQVEEVTGKKNPRFWLVISGGKSDFTCKWWSPERLQEVIDAFPDVMWVQVGQEGKHGSLIHYQPKLKNVVDLVGKTDVRQLIRLVYHSDGVLCPVTGLMHLAAAVPTKQGRPKNRPAVVIAGGREPSQWEAYPHHQFLHTNGCLPCCDNGGCWKSRVVALGDGDEKDRSVCLRPIYQAIGDDPALPGRKRVLPQCLDMISSNDVIRAVQKCLMFNKVN